MISDIKSASTDSLLYAQKDLREVIAVQEAGERQFPGTYKKLGQYHDDLAAVDQELNRRRGLDCCKSCRRPLP
jgi:hypothetical protein